MSAALRSDNRARWIEFERHLARPEVSDRPIATGPNETKRVADVTLEDISRICTHNPLTNGGRSDQDRFIMRFDTHLIRKRHQERLHGSEIAQVMPQEHRDEWIAIIVDALLVASDDGWHAGVGLLATEIDDHPDEGFRLAAERVVASLGAAGVLTAVPAEAPVNRKDPKVLAALIKSKINRV